MNLQAAYDFFFFSENIAEKKAFVTVLKKDRASVDVGVTDPKEIRGSNQG